MGLAIGSAKIIHQLPANASLLPATKARHLRSESARLLRFCIMYFAASSLSGEHYLVEPPSSYGTEANITISLSCIAAAALLFEAWRYKANLHEVIARQGPSYTSLQKQQHAQIELTPTSSEADELRPVAT